MPCSTGRYGKRHIIKGLPPGIENQWRLSKLCLPKENERVLVFHTRYQIMYHHNGIWYSDRDITYGTTSSVQFWMPLPSQPTIK